MVTIDKQEVYRTFPIVRGNVAELFDPDDAPVPASSNSSVRRAPRGVNGLHAAQMERIDQPESCAG
jgi:hypothetical protein